MRNVRIFIVSLIVFGTAVSGCSEKLMPQGDWGRKVEISGSSWYDYGNGLINLSNVTQINSDFAVSIDVGTREAIDLGDEFSEYFKTLSEEDRIRIGARSDFCFDMIHADGQDARRNRNVWTVLSRSGSIPAIVSGDVGKELDTEIKKIGNYARAEFARACAISLNLQASLEFDAFTVILQQQELKIIMPQEYFEAGEQLSDDKAGEFFRQKIASQIAKAKTDYGNSYNGILRKGGVFQFLSSG